MTRGHFRGKEVVGGGGKEVVSASPGVVGWGCVCPRVVMGFFLFSDEVVEFSWINLINKLSNKLKTSTVGSAAL